MTIATPSTLASFVDLANYALRKNSSGINVINITDDQLSDRVMEALEYYGQFHAEAKQKNYISHKITGSHLQLTTNVSSNFTKGVTVTGITSNATMIVYDTPEINKIRTKTFSGTFIEGETITDGTNTAIIAPSGIFIGDLQNGYITLPDEIISVLRVLPVGSGLGASGTGAFMFDVNYQITLRMLTNYANVDLFDYYLMQQNLSMIDMIFSRSGSGVMFSRILGKLEFQVQNYVIDDFIVMEVYHSVVNQVNTRIYNDFWVKRYATALVKRQWAENLGKYKNVILPGGITINAAELWEQSAAEIDKLEEMMQTTYMSPLGMFIG